MNNYNAVVNAWTNVIELCIAVNTSSGIEIIKGVPAGIHLLNEYRNDMEMTTTLNGWEVIFLKASIDSKFDSVLVVRNPVENEYTYLYISQSGYTMIVTHATRKPLEVSTLMSIANLNTMDEITRPFLNNPTIGTNVTIDLCTTYHGFNGVNKTAYKSVGVSNIMEGTRLLIASVYPENVEPKTNKRAEIQKLIDLLLVDDAQPPAHPVDVVKFDRLEARVDKILNSQLIERVVSLERSRDLEATKYEALLDKFESLSETLNRLLEGV